ncbi:MAG: hypothetical protein IPO59_20805 [Betaproteobacteria bacterium]|nr:hypothetical protein [Betaproteobacteria bacterium]
MWPVADRLTAWLQQRFRAREDDEAQPRHLDKNVLAVPTLALDALGPRVRPAPAIWRFATGALGPGERRGRGAGA